MISSGYKKGSVRKTYISSTGPARRVSLDVPALFVTEKTGFPYGCHSRRGTASCDPARPKLAGNGRKCLFNRSFRLISRLLSPGPALFAVAGIDHGGERNPNALAICRQLWPSARSGRAWSGLNTRCGLPSRVPRPCAARMPVTTRGRQTAALRSHGRYKQLVFEQDGLKQRLRSQYEWRVINEILA
jgi:hypothetical protein